MSGSGLARAGGLLLTANAGLCHCRGCGAGASTCSRPSKSIMARILQHPTTLAFFREFARQRSVAATPPHCPCRPVLDDPC